MLDLHAPVKCATCKQEIKKGEKYWRKRAGYEYHLDCEPPMVRIKTGDN